MHLSQGLKYVTLHIDTHRLFCLWIQLYTLVNEKSRISTDRFLLRISSFSIQELVHCLYGRYSSGIIDLGTLSFFLVRNNF